jgi:hypothetical protein
VSLALANLSASAPERVPVGDGVAQDDVTADSGELAQLDLQAWSEPPDLVAWSRAGFEVSRVTVAAKENPIGLPAGEGCLVLLRAGAAPLTIPASLAPSTVTVLRTLEWSHGSIVRGSVVDPDGIPIGGASVGASAARRDEKSGDEDDDHAARTALASLSHVERHRPARSSPRPILSAKLVAAATALLSTRC